MGGIGDSAEYLDSVELLDLTGTQSCSNLARLPKRLRAPVADFYEDELRVCGGSQVGDPTDECYTYDPEDDVWNAAPALIQARAYAAAGRTGEDWVIAGGSSGPNSLGSATSEYFVYGDDESNEGPSSVETMQDHCIVEFGANQMVVAGFSSRKSYILDWPTQRFEDGVRID